MDKNFDINELNELLELDKVIHERVRLGIMSALSTTNQLTFNDLKEILKVTDGNLGMHLRLLEKNKYISVEKKFYMRKPQTSYKIVSEGKKALENYLDIMEKLLRGIRG